jgi:hypothetical protein
MQALVLQGKSTLRVSPKIQHFWVDQSTGILDQGGGGTASTLKEIMMNGYEALSGTGYVPARTAAAPASPFLSMSASGASYSGHLSGHVLNALEGRIREKLETLENEELCALITDEKLFMDELQIWLAETDSGQMLAKMQRDLVRVAQTNKDLKAVCAGATICVLCCCALRVPDEGCLRSLWSQQSHQEIPVVYMIKLANSSGRCSKVFGNVLCGS